MAQRRMFSLKVVDTDTFLDMGQGAQLLYFHMAMRADDDGFVDGPKKIMRFAGAKEDDFRVLVAKQFILPFQSGVIVIRHWKENNLIRADRKQPTKYQEEMAQLGEDCNGDYQMTTDCQPIDNQVSPQVRLGKVRLGKSNTSPLPPKGGKSGSRDFEDFWKEYPKKEAKKRCAEIWKRKRLDGKVIEILGFIDKAKKSDRWRKGFIVMPSTFLNQERWNDDIESYYDKEQTGGVVDLSNL